jgi:hypothetical protein
LTGFYYEITTETQSAQKNRLVKFLILPSACRLHAVLCDLCASVVIVVLGKLTRQPCVRGLLNHDAASATTRLGAAALDF